MTPVDIPKWTGKVYKVSVLPRTIVKLGKLRVRKMAFPWGRAHQMVVQCQIVSPENIYTSNITQTEQGILRNIDA